MNATIQERKFSLRSEYDITSPVGNYFAQKAFLSLLANIELRTLDQHVVATIHGNFTLFKADYDIALADGRNFHYATESLWKSVDSCIGPTASYHLFQHRGVRCSIFKDDTQIAAVTRNRMIVGNGHEYDIQMNHDADFIVIACMIIALNTEGGEDREQNTFTYDFGNIGPEGRKFDENWQPT